MDSTSNTTDNDLWLHGVGHISDGHSCTECANLVEEQGIREISYYDGWRDGWAQGSKDSFEEVLGLAKSRLESRGVADNWAVLDVIAHARQKLLELAESDTGS